MNRCCLDICYDRVLPDETTKTREMPHVDRLALWTSKMWTPGDKIPVSFIGGSSAQRQHVVDVATRLSQIAYLDFQFVDSGGTIRIAFNPSLGAWSNIGKDALSVPRSQPTMNLGFDQPGTYTHEWTHAVGAIHEHQSPFNNPIKWNKSQVNHDLSGPPNNWDQGTIDHNMYEKYALTLLNGTEFDPQSVMLYSFPPSWTIDGFHVEPNAVLSAKDILWLATKYPGRTTTPPVVVPPVVPPTPPVNPPTHGDYVYTLRSKSPVVLTQP